MVPYMTSRKEQNITRPLLQLSLWLLSWFLYWWWQLLHCAFAGEELKMVTFINYSFRSIKN